MHMYGAELHSNLSIQPIISVSNKLAGIRNDARVAYTVIMSIAGTLPLCTEGV